METLLVYSICFAVRLHSHVSARFLPGTLQQLAASTAPAAPDRIGWVPRWPDALEASFDQAGGSQEATR